MPYKDDVQGKSRFHYTNDDGGRVNVAARATRGKVELSTTALASDSLLEIVYDCTDSYD